MKQKVKENIEDNNIAKILYYLEKNTSDFNYLALGDAMVGDYLLTFSENFCKIYDRREQVVFYGKIKLLADNIVGIWGSLKNLEQ